MKEVIRIGGASGFWGESATAVPQLLADGELDYLVFDYLAEVTMSILARARSAQPELGYAIDFVTAVMGPNLSQLARQGVKVISNAGGVNPNACAAAIRKQIDKAGLDLTVAVVSGDDLLTRASAYAQADTPEMYTGEAFPATEQIASINAYLGAFPIARALDADADIVITGRTVDSAVTLGACIHHFGWQPTDLHRLAGGSLAGHILECSTQASGGNFTDWETVAGSMADIGYPIAQIAEDGGFVLSKPAGTGGAVTVGTVSEQLLYEIGDPQAYLLPDVTCDFSAVRVLQLGENRVAVSGALGTAPPVSYKVSATFADGYRGGQVLFFYGDAANRKAQAYADAVVTRAKRRIDALGLDPCDEISIELIGDESYYGAAGQISQSREVALKIAARHPQREGVAILLRETIGLALGGPPGLTMFQGGRPKPSPVVRLFSFLVPRDSVPVEVTLNGTRLEVPAAPVIEPAGIVRPRAPTKQYDGPMQAVSLARLAWGRSGDKGNHANIGIIARHADFLPWIWAALTEEAVAGRFAHFLNGSVMRYLLPGPNAINFVLHDVLGGGGIASLRNDPQGKGYAQLLLAAAIPIPQTMAENLK